MNTKICWDHFSKDDFTNEVTDEKIAQCKLGKLKIGVVPSQNLPQ